MSQDAQKMVELMNVLALQEMARRIPKEGKEKMTLLEKSFHELAWYKFEDKENV